MRVPVRFAKIAPLGLWALVAFPGGTIQAQEISRPRVIEDANLAACVNRLGQNMVLDGVAKVPFTMKIEVLVGAASGAQPKITGDPATAACIDLLAQSFARSGAARLPFVIRATPAP